jgi:hypothetical protein
MRAGCMPIKKTFFLGVATLKTGKTYNTLCEPQAKQSQTPKKKETQFPTSLIF